MLLTPTNLNLFFTALETRFWTAYTAAPLIYNKIATTYPVGTEQWVSGWIGMLDKLREWIGPRVTRTPAPQTYLVPMQLFELTEGIDQFKLKDDTYGIYNPIVDFMGIQGAKWPDYQLRDLIQNQNSQSGTARQASLDALSHWNTAHPIDFYDASKGTYPNDYTSGGQTINGIVIGGALAANSFATVWEDMSRRKSETGESQNVAANLAMVGPMLKLALDTILQAQFMGLPVIGSIGTAAVNPNPPTGGLTPNAPLVGATENVMKGWTDRLVWLDLGGSTSIGGGTMDQVWYLMDTSKPIKPFSWLLNQAPDFTYRNQPQDPIVYDTHTYSFGTVARGAPAWSFPWLSSRSGP